MISDVDAGSVIATLTLSSAAAGSLTIATSNLVTSTYDPATGIWNASGLLADVNTLLKDFESARKMMRTMMGGKRGPGMKLPQNLPTR